MKKLIIALIVFTSLFFTLSLKVGAVQNDAKRIRCTCYIDTGITASGEYTRNGIIAGRKEDLGKKAALYQINEDGTMGKLIGYYIFLDTGAGMDTDGDGKGDSIKKGLSIDVWKPTLKEAKEWIKKYGDYVYIEIIEQESK